MNKVILKGRLTKDPEIKHINDEMSVTKFSVAVDRKVKAGMVYNLSFYGKEKKSRDDKWSTNIFAENDEDAIKQVEEKRWKTLLL